MDCAAQAEISSRCKDRDLGNPEPVFLSLLAKPDLCLLLGDHLSYVLTIWKQPKRCIRSLDKITEMNLGIKNNL